MLSFLFILGICSLRILEMGSSNDSNIKAIDASVGGLVWVRRRNGSWWPGRILGLDELSEGCLVSPKAGTPVKLLGREDASIDWYNLEKSKRVKAFRCGEYNECIEKAKAAAANSPKKAVKYARREDAILHALELESICLGQNCLNFGCRKDISGGKMEILARESPSISSGNVEDDEMADVSLAGNSSDLAPDLSQLESSFEESSYVNSYKVQSRQGMRKTPNDSENDWTEGVLRMKDLEDLGLSGVSNGKVQAEGQLELVQPDNASLHDSNNGNSSNGKIPNGSNSSLKRRRSQVPIVHEFLKRKCRRRTLMKVLESTAMVSVPIICEELPNSCGSSPLWSLHDCRLSALESNEPKESASIETNSTGVSHGNGASLNDDEAVKTKDYKISSLSELADDDNLFDVPFVGEDNLSLGFSPILVSCTSVKSAVGASQRHYSRSNQADIVSPKTERVNASGYASSAGAPGNNLNHKVEKGSSKWQSKRKRNSRQTSRKREQVSTRYVGMDDDSTIVAGDEIEGESSMKRRETEANPFSEGSMAHRRLLVQQLQSRPIIHSDYQFPGFVRNIDSDTSLYDVKLEVKASYRPQHVPLVSLMSKLNGKAIVGHPLTVEILEDGYSYSIFIKTESDMEGDENGFLCKQLALQPRISTGKSPKTKKAGQLSKKIRKLSTLTSCKQLKNEQQSVMGKPRGTVVSCIPLKVVFSRINEAMNSSTRPSPRAATSSNP